MTNSTDMKKENISPHFPTSPSLSFYYNLTAANRLDVSLTHAHTHTQKHVGHIHQSNHIPGDIFNAFSLSCPRFLPCILILFSYKIFRIQFKGQILYKAIGVLH